MINLVKNQLKTPVVFMVFNRPDTTKRVFDEIRKARPAKLLLVADGPRHERPGEEQQCGLVRDIIDNVDWPCEIYKNFSDVNLGCRTRISSGLDWAFNLVEEAIILEDDCLPHIDFFRFCEEMLIKYRNDTRIGLIRGDNWPGYKIKRNESYCYSIYPSIWGWASWKRVWQYYDVNIREFNSSNENFEWLMFLLGGGMKASLFQGYFEKVKSNKLNTWDYQLNYSLWKQSQLSIVPSVNLISNIGIGENSTHSFNRSDMRLIRDTESLLFPLIHPKSLTYNSRQTLRNDPYIFRLEYFLHITIAKLLLCILQYYKSLKALLKVNKHA